MKYLSPFGVAVATITWVAPAVAVRGPQDPRRPMTVDDQSRLVMPGAPALSPDGQWVLYTVERSSLAENARRSATWLASTQGGVPPREFLRDGDGSLMGAPTSRSVFFLRSVASGDQ